MIPIDFKIRKLPANGIIFSKAVEVRSFYPGIFRNGLSQKLIISFNGISLGDDIFQNILYRKVGIENFNLRLWIIFSQFMKVRSRFPGWLNPKKLANMTVSHPSSKDLSFIRISCNVRSSKIDTVQ